MYRFTVIQNSDFNLLNRFISGEDIHPILEQRYNLGFNSPRVWTGYNIPLIGRLIPREHPDFYYKIPEFMETAAQYGMYPEITAFTGPYNGIFDNDDQKVGHWESLKVCLAPCTNLLDLELVNECFNTPNRNLPWDRLTRPPGPMLASHGSNIQDAEPMQPVWGVAGYRPKGGDEWHRKVGHNAMEMADIFNIPVWSNEATRMPDNDSSEFHAYDAAAAAALLCAGSCFHSPGGKNSTLWTGRELSCAQQWAKGALSIDLNCQDGGYIHRIDLEKGNIIRAYQRSSCVVPIRK